MVARAAGTEAGATRGTEAGATRGTEAGATRGTEAGATRSRVGPASLPAWDFLVGDPGAAGGGLARRPLLIGLASVLLAVAGGCTDSAGPAAVPPLETGRITSAFGLRAKHPVTRAPGPVHHAGFDLAAPAGTAIRAARAGVVTAAGWRGGYGNMVEIKHVAGLTTRYAHAARVAVRPGMRVQAGEVIAYVGSTGLSTGPHLHYELRLYGKAIDPRDAGFALVAAEAPRARSGKRRRT